MRWSMLSRTCSSCSVIADARLNQLEHSPIGERLATELDANVGERLADEIRDCLRKQRRAEVANAPATNTAAE